MSAQAVVARPPWNARATGHGTGVTGQVEVEHVAAAVRQEAPDESEMKWNKRFIQVRGHLP